MRSPLGRAIGLGSAKEGVEHWWAQRVTAMALVPLACGSSIAVIGLVGADRAAVVAWLHSPLPAVLLILLLVATFYHSALGLQVVIEDYVHGEGCEARPRSIVDAPAAASCFAAARRSSPCCSIALGA